MNKQSLRPQDWIEDFVNRHENRVYRTAIAILGNTADASDIMQDVFLKVLEGKAPDFSSIEHETAWLVKVTVNLCRSKLRSFWWRKTEALLDCYPAKEKEQYVLLDLVFSLPKKYRTVIYLYYYEGYSTKEIAQLTTQKETTIRSLLHRARLKLKDALTGEQLL